MQYVGFALVALLALFSPVANAQDLKVKVEPIVEGKAAPGQEYTLKLKFTVPDGYHAYHKDNPGVSSPVKVTWKDTAGLKLAKETWPEPKKTKIDEDWFEWELGPVFEIAYHFNVPTEAKGTLLLKGSHDTQFCNDEGCLQSEGDFEAKVEVGTAGAAKEELPKVTLAAKFAEPAVAGGQAKLTLAFTFTAGFHAYHKDNPGFGEAPAISFTKLGGLKLAKEEWPEPTKKQYDEDWVEWEYKDAFTLTYTYDVPKDAKDSIDVAGQYHIQVCDDNGCHIRKSEFKATLAVKPAGDTGERRGSGNGFGPSLPKAYGQLAGDSDDRKLKVSAAFAGPVKAGTEAELRIEFEVAAGYKTYHRDNHSKEPIGISVPTTLNWPALSGLQPTTDIWPEPVDNEGEWELKGKFVVVQKFQVPLDASGEITLQGVAHAQICDAEGCLPPDDFAFTASLVIEPAEDAATTTETRETDSTSTAAASAEPAAADRTARDEHGFYLDFDYALEQARKEGKQLLVDFNGRSCVPCRKMEKQVFPLPEVKQLMDDFVIVSVQNDIQDARYNELWAKYKPSATAGVPYYAIMDHDAKVLRGIGSTLPAEERAHEFVAFLKGTDPVKSDEQKTTGETSLPKPAPGSSDASDWPQGLLPGMYPRVSQGFDFEARFSTDKIKPGAEVTLELRFKLKNNEEGYPYHLHHPKTPSSFAVPLEILLKGAEGLKPVGEPQFPAWTEHYDEDLDDMNYYLLGEVVVVQKYLVPADLKPGKYRAWGQIKGQFCDSAGCISFEAEEPEAVDRQVGFVASIEVAADGSDSTVTVIEPGTETGSGTSGKEKTGLLLFLLIAFGAGMITLLTPCVLPVLPLTIGFFVGQAEKGKSSLLTAFIYCTCIVASFTAFGLITTLALGATGAQDIATNGYVNIFLALMFTVFALSFLGLFELRVPAFMTAWFTKKQMTAQKEGHGYAKAFFSGAAFSLISFSCTGPIAGTFLAQAATGSVWQPTLAMLAFSSGMALPIFIMGQFPSVMKKMPKSGGWMNAMKVVFGFIEIGLAIMYLSAAEQSFRSIQAAEWVNRYMVLAVWAAVSFASALYLFGFFRMPHDHEDTKQIGVIRGMFAVIFLSFGLYMLPGLFGARYGAILEGILPPPPAEGGIQLAVGGGEKRDAHDLPWHKNELEAGLKASKESGKPVFIDFTGYN